MAGNRTLKLSILADVDNLRKNLAGAENDVQGFGDKISKFGKIAGAAFVAAGVAAAAYASKLAIDGVKAAIEDEAAQLRLATSLKNVTGATDAQIKATEDYILQTSLATGVTDDELRPSLDRLVRATKDVAAAQKLQTVAIDVAAGSGKSLEAVTNAMAKAAEGNTAALGKLGLGLSAAELKTMSMDEVTKRLADTFGGQAANQADTFQGKMARLQVAFNEGKETIGSFILDAITPMIDTVVNTVIPAVTDFINSIGGTEGLTGVFKTYIELIKNIFKPVLEGFKSAFNNIRDAVMENKDEFTALFNFLKDFVAPLLGGALKLAIQGIGLALKVIINFVGDLIGGFEKLVGFIDRVIEAIKSLINLVRNNPIVRGITGAIDNAFGGARAAGGPVSAGTTYLVGEKGPELFTPNSTGAIIPNGGNRASTTINLTVNGAIDPEGTARTIVDVLNRATARGGSGAGAFAY